MNKIIMTILLGLTTVFGEISYPGLLTWSHTPTIALAGGGRILFGAEGDRLNPAVLSYEKNRQFHASLIQFPADIRLESFSILFPTEISNKSLSFRHQSLGIFDGYDESGNETGKYQSGETIITGSFSKKVQNMPLRWGVSSSIFYSQLYNYSSVAIALNGGVLLDIPIIKSVIGINFENVGFPLSSYTDHKESLPSQMAVSLSKKLAHLPLQIMLEAPYSFQTEELNIILSGEFKLINGIQIRLGTSSERINQNIQQSVSQSAISGTGLGINYVGKDYSIGIGSYFYGTGEWINGIEFGGNF
ncbi:MAG: hypothetical protein ISR83_02120 [Candidatus Marinimicrobia bacterium]|nr:hypothetical protein [Candidatus Neomarinimicrobiota bacterium]